MSSSKNLNDTRLKCERIFGDKLKAADFEFNLAKMAGNGVLNVLSLFICMHGFDCCCYGWHQHAIMKSSTLSLIHRICVDFTVNFSIECGLRNRRHKAHATSHMSTILALSGKSTNR